MEECFKCYASGNKVMLSDAISEKGIVKICGKCSSEEDLPIVKKPSIENISDPKVYERLSRMSNHDFKERPTEKRKELLKKQETTLRDLVDKKFEMTLQSSKPSSNLVDNFHWIIMRARRLKHVNQQQLAEAIAEPEAAVKQAEKGILSEDNQQLINKLENYLKINITKKKQEDLGEKELPAEISFDPMATKTITISDLQEMKKEKEDEIFSKQETYTFNENIELHPEISEEQPEFIIKKNKDKEDLSEEDINDLVFRR